MQAATILENVAANRVNATSTGLHHISKIFADAHKNCENQLPIVFFCVQASAA